MSFPTAMASSARRRRRPRSRGARFSVEGLERRRLLDGGVPAGMSLGQANWFYQNVFLPPAKVASEWNGNVASGDAGTLGADYLAAIIARVDAYRWMAGFPGGVTLDTSEDPADQQDALMTAANDQLNHFPPSTWIDYTAAGAQAAGLSDLALESSGTGAIDLYMMDPGANNTFVGHRRWVLDPQTQTMGIGDIPGQSDTLQVVQSQSTPVPAVTTVAWPPAGFVPLPLIPNRWSLEDPDGSDFTKATVAVTENGVPQQVQILSNSGLDYGDSQAIVWDMPNAPAPQPGQQTVYTVQVDNVVINGQSQSFSYTTTAFDPSTTTESTPVPAAIGFLQASAQVDPAAGSITIDVARSMNADQTVSVAYATSDGTAPAGTNYVSTSGVLTFQPGQFYEQIVVPILPGDAQHPDGTFSVILSSPTGATVGPIGSFEVTINPPPPSQPAPPALLPSEEIGTRGSGITDDASPILTGTTQANATVDLVDSTGTVLATTTAGADGTYSVSVPGAPLSPGTYVFGIIASNAGGSSPDSYTFTLTIVAPTTVTINPPPTIISEQVLFTRKLNKHGKPAGKPVVRGFELEFSEAMNAATAGNASNYQLGWTSSRKVKKHVVTIFHPVPFTVPYSDANDSVSLLLIGKEAFAKGGQLTVIAAPPDGVSSASGVLLNGNGEGVASDGEMFTILPRARGIMRG